jgi:hypothetical protein
MPRIDGSVILPEAVEPPGACVYHYTRLDLALERILPAQELKLSPFSTMRDPREASDWLLSASGFGDDPDGDATRWVEFNRRVNELKSYIKILSLTRDDEDRSSDVFGRGFAHPRLWENYADNHRGVCLCFDREILTARLAEQLESYGRVHHGPVSYGDTEIAASALHVILDELRAQGPTDAASAHLAENIDELFFTKLTDWETELEYRFVIQTDQREPLFARVNPALRAVILGADDGCRFYEPAFAKICDPAGIAIFQMRWIHGRPHLAPRHDPPTI